MDKLGLKRGIPTCNAVAPRSDLNAAKRPPWEGVSEGCEVEFVLCFEFAGRLASLDMY